MAIRGQFRRNGNVYFLVIGILMFIGYYTPLFESAISPWTTLGPLAIVISVSLAQEAYTDAQRHRSDKATNYHPCVVLKLPIAFESVFRMNIHAGDLVVVRNREMIPVDLILLASSNEGGSAYIETSSIDGETNLKLRNSPHLPSVRPGVTGGDNSPFIATLTSEPPNTHVNNYSGKLTLPPMTPGEPSENAPLNAENILLRGAMLRNTEWVVGVACFTGADTKLVMNSVATPSKFSQLDMLINRTVVLILAIMIICVCSLGGLSLTASNKEFDNLWYAGTTPNYLQNVFLFVTMLSNFVPLSLYVSVEIITVMMMLYVSWDLQMYHKDSDTPASARSTIVTDLGLVDYIFSDKTGTLTCNIMEFKRCSVDGHVFGMPVAKAAPADSSQPVLDKGESNISSDSVHPLKHLLAGSNSTGVKGEKLTFNAEMFLRVMSICHTVVVEKDHDGAPAGYAYQAESPDEGALVSAASNEYGFQLLGRDFSGVKISCSCPSLTETWSILAVNKFDSDRKRMSVLVRSPPELGSVPILLCKGADSSMLIEGVCEGVKQLDSFASEGLRTLVLGVKMLSEEAAAQWLTEFKAASTSIENRDKKLTAVAYDIERDLHIVGATAIEDKLQDGVPETIANLGKAGIKLWVLTGDKRETAIEIGYSTKVLTPKMHLTEVVDGPDDSRTVFERLFAVDRDVRKGCLVKHLKDEYKEALVLDAKEQTGKKEIKSMFGIAEEEEPHNSPAQNVPFDISSVKRGLVVEGAALKHLLGDPVLEEMLFAVASCCESVIACRVSPIQKALLLKMVRKYVEPTPTTLAIGDGANDVGMIQEAHIGIGISGLEGQQAVNASDFAIAQFRYLESLLLIHGRWNFMRMSKAVLFFFYKNACLIGCLMVFSGQCLHSGTPLFDPWIIAVFNFVGGSIPIIFMAAFDRDLPRDYVMRHPEVYKSGPSNEFLSMRMTIRWTFITVIQALTVYHFSAPALTLGGGTTSAFKGLMGNWDREVGDGEGGDLKVFGTTIYSNLIYVVTLKALFETRSIINGEFPTFTCRKGKGEGWPNRMGYTWVGISWGSVLFYIWFLYMYEMVGRRGVSDFFDYIYTTGHVLNMRSITWMMFILTPTVACIFDVSGKVYGNMFYPTQTQIHAEIALKESKQKKS
ncbi:hypothetical protein THAPSDRAFT_26702 [Thalassiosira pseudonana CCMP1335]|uniref:Phospholipid-transporting ATPase n=1 Tax=Thalassiosira pseudonana TaxID=35128 RepID=B8BR31_THAPS|nr:hypothetical protein THAPSDRAFT_26702 [Thalassiosira pseudonana CCMP1335]EED95897.1 hypothetical protein THAPSDRAFT_26702 [Thalassiosira pseudonana CCMP1335]